MFDQVITLVSVIISGISVLSAVFTMLYQTRKGQKFEIEKTKLEIYSQFIAYCQKKASCCSTPDDDFELMKIHAKLSLTTDHKLNEHTEALYTSLFSNPQSSETIRLLEEELQQMWLRLKIFNRRFGQCFPHG